MQRKIKSWGRVNDFNHEIVNLNTKDDISVKMQRADKHKTVLAHGMGRSYGDSNLNSEGVLFDTTRMNNFISADWKAGIVKVQAGVTLDDLLQVSVPKGWFLPVTPGTKHVTIGGAVANNVHGKNHHKVGSFGNFIISLALQRSNTNKFSIICSPEKNSKLFEVTIGGLGLSGIIEWVELKLIPIKSSYLKVENIPYDSIDSFFKLNKESETWDYTVAWLNCFSTGGKIGSGIYSRAYFSEQGALEPHQSNPKLTWPIETPIFFMNKFSIKTFNWLYRHRPRARFQGHQHYNSFFFPLDGISNWNRLYGRKGFYQHQSIFSPNESKAAITKMLKLIELSGQGSFLAVLKQHGPETSPGLLSFCKEGLSLALDFPNRGLKTLNLLAELDGVVEFYSGRLYPAKDGHMSSELFKASYPNWEKIEQHRDPKISSSFWRRVTLSAKDD